MKHKLDLSPLTADQVFKYFGLKIDNRLIFNPSRSPTSMLEGNKVGKSE